MSKNQFKFDQVDRQFDSQLQKTSAKTDTKKWPLFLYPQSTLSVNFAFAIADVFSAAFLLLFSPLISKQLADKVTSDKQQQQQRRSTNFRLTFESLSLSLLFANFFSVFVRSFAVSNFRFWFSMPAPFGSFCVQTFFCICFCWSFFAIGYQIVGLLGRTWTDY